MYSLAAAFPDIQAGRPSHHPFRGLLGVHSRCGLLARGIALCDPFHRRLRRFRYLYRRSDCFRLERRVAGRDFHPLENQHLTWRTE